MSRSADPVPAIRANLRSAVGNGGVRATAGSLVVGTLLLGVPAIAVALPAGTSAPVVDVVGPVVAFYAGTAEVDGSTTLEPTKEGTKSRLDCTILFGKDSDVLRPGAKERLRRLADQLHAQGAGRVAVTGYTDDLGSAAHGLDLSERRARRVAHELRQVLPAKRFPMAVRGLGEAHPAVPNTSEANRRKNRRVVVTLTRAEAPSPPAASSTSAPSSTSTPTPTPTPTDTPMPTATVSTSATASPSGTPTPSAVAPPPPPGPPSSAGPAEPATVPWPWIGGAGAALIVAGALVDAVRRRHRTPVQAADAEGAEVDPPTDTATPAATTGAAQLSDQQNRHSSSAPKDADGPSSSSGDPAVVVGPSTLVTDVHEADGRVAPYAPVAPIDEGNQVSKLEAALAADLAAWQSADTYRPRLSLLGPIQARTRGKALARRRPYYTELLAYLALRPRGATVDEIADDFSLTPARVRTDMKILRDWLGADPRTGTAYLPDARTTPAALQRGVAVYQLDGALCDLDLFDRLQSLARGKTPGERNADLQTALGLVTGRPFDQARPAGWSWLFEGDRIDLHATQAVVEVAVDLIAYYRTHDEDEAVDGVAGTLAKIDPEKAQQVMSGAMS